MRTITLSHRNASQDHLLAESNLLLVAEYLGLTCSQFLLSASHRNHPSKAVVNLPTGSGMGRKKKVHTLQSRFGHIVQPYLNDEDIMPEVTYKDFVPLL
jgi:hypothetical protein